MQRESNVQTLNWADKTMSVLRLQQLEACEKRLSACLSFGLFSDCDDVRVEELWETSYEAGEQGVLTELHTTEGLQQRVLAQLPQEAALLSVEEHLLVERMLLFDGEAELLDVEEAAAAESLLARMWCYLRKEDDRFILCLPEALREPLLTAMESPAHEKTREKLFRYDATIRGLLYISGFLHFEQPLHHLICDVLDGDTRQTTLAMRFLRASYDYFYDEQGAMVLLHPGLAEPERVIGAVRCKDLSFEMNETVLAGAISGAFPEEIPLCEMMLGLLRGAVRPEISEEEAVEDLRMLAKQGVSLAEMNEVLSSLLAVLPTPDMLEGVRLIYQQTPRWALMKSAVMH